MLCKPPIITLARNRAPQNTNEIFWPLRCFVVPFFGWRVFLLLPSSLALATMTVRAGRQPPCLPACFALYSIGTTERAAASQSRFRPYLYCILYFPALAVCVRAPYVFFVEFITTVVALVLVGCCVVRARRCTVAIFASSQSLARCFPFFARTVHIIQYSSIILYIFDANNNNNKKKKKKKKNRNDATSTALCTLIQLSHT